MFLIEVFQVLDIESSQDSPVSLIDVYSFVTLDYLLDLSERCEADQWVLRLHHVNDVKFVVCVGVTRGRARLDNVLALETQHHLLLLR